MAAINKVTLIGNLGKDPEIRMAGASKVANFSLGITEKYTDRNGAKQEKTEWVDIVFWERQAEIIEQYVKKGSSLYVEGKLTTRSWEQDGQKRYKTEVQGLSFQMLGGNSSNQTRQKVSNSKPASVNLPSPPPELNDLPF